MNGTMTSVWLIPVVLLAAACGGPKERPVVVGSKNFTEQVVLGEIIAQHLEKRLGRKVDRKLNLGGTLLTHQGLLSGELDLYPEYTGTGIAAILKEQPSGGADAVYERMRSEYARLHQFEVFPPLGVDNTFLMVVSKKVAQEKKISTLSQAAKVQSFWKLGAGFEFQERPDGFAALTNYRLEWIQPPRAMDLGLLYKALEEGHVNMLAANATDGLLDPETLVGLEDDQHVFPPYQVCIVARQQSLREIPGLREALAELSGKLNNETMRRLNAAVDSGKKPPAEVAAGFLKSAGLQ
jgi:glycine betaine/choline ABC-type transport system substrate-binding protein